MLTVVEIRRKLLHLSSLTIPIGYILTSKRTALIVLVSLLFGFLTVDLLRRYHARVASLFNRYIIGTILREQERGRLMGSTYFLLSSVLVVFLFPARIAIVSLLILIVSDTCAAWVGKGFGRCHLFGKTLEGSLAFLISALVIVWIYPGLDRLAGSLAAVGATVIELLSVHLDDNFTSPFAAGAILFFVGG